MLSSNTKIRTQTVSNNAEPTLPDNPLTSSVENNSYLCKRMFRMTSVLFLVSLFSKNKFNGIFPPLSQDYHMSTKFRALSLRYSVGVPYIFSENKSTSRVLASFVK